MASGETAALKVESLTKDYGNFKLDKVCFELPKGYVMGFVGRNGAGKSTTLSCIMRSVIPDGGKVTVDGEDISENEIEVKRKIAFSSGTFESFPRAKGDALAKVYSTFYPSFDFDKFEKLKRRFSLDGTKRLKEMSAGMRVKFSVALAMSHDAKLYVFDEPTSGLDPVSRDEMLDLFCEMIEDGESSVLFSTHITSDLDKIADYLTLIDGGRIIASGVKNEILDAHALVSGGELTDEVRQKAIAYKKTPLNYTALLKKSDLPIKGAEMSVRPDIEQLLIYYAKAGGSRE